jgi:hypothetical protein
MGWFGLLIVVPWCTCGFFRIRLWRQRDEIVSERLAGDLPEGDATRFLETRIENTIALASKYTIANCLISPSPPKELLETRNEILQNAMDELTDSECARFENHVRKFNHTVVVYLMRGTPIGWMCFVLWSLWYFGLGIVKSIKLFRTARYDLIQFARENTIRKTDEVYERLVELLPPSSELIAAGFSPEACV